LHYPGSGTVWTATTNGTQQIDAIATAGTTSFAASFAMERMIFSVPPQCGRI